MVKPNPNFDINELKEHSDAIYKLMEKINESGTVGQLSGMSQEQIEQLYSLGYNLYEAQNYEQARRLFAMLGLLDSSNSKYIFGCAACLHAQNKYEEAFETYQLAFLMDSLNNPEPLYNAAICLIKLGRKEEAHEVLGVADVCGHDDDERHQIYKGKCLELRNMLAMGLKNKESLGK